MWTTKEVDPGFTTTAANGEAPGTFAAPEAGHTWIRIEAVFVGIEPLMSYMVAMVEAPAVVGSEIVGAGTVAEPLVMLIVGTRTSNDSCIVDRFVALTTN